MKVRSTRRSFLRLAGAALAASPLSPRLLSAQQDAVTATLDPDHSLWYGEPAAHWAEALPLGNGRLGAMVFGGTKHERLALNEDTLWSGAPRDCNNPGAAAHLSTVRKLVLEQADYQAADAECRKMQGPFNEAYQPAGDLVLDFAHGQSVADYRRELDLDAGCSKTSYIANHVRYTRQAFISRPAQVMVVKISAKRPGAMNCTIRLQSLLHGKAEAGAANEIHFTGKAPSESLPNYLKDPDPIHYSEVEGQGMRFAIALQASTVGGKIFARPDGTLAVEQATSLLLLVNIATGFRGYAQMPDLSAAEVLATALGPVRIAAREGYASLFADHLADHRGLYRRAALHLGSPAVVAQSTAQRVKSFAERPDPTLAALYFHYGRYLLIASSRPQTQPANLQGIWSDELRPPWSSNWTSNINVQMNYWLAETCNLSTCHSPLFDMVTDLSRNGTATAKVNYGCKGWVSHHNIDLWRQSAPVGLGKGDPTWANFCMSAPWLCAHFYEHYLFTGDRAFLQSVYPVLKGVAEFCLDWLIDDGHGLLTTCPSFSTENTFLAPNGKVANVSSGCTLDLALIRELFTSVRQASAVLGVDHAFAESLKAPLARLTPYRIGRFGLQEWSIDFDETTPGQRHMSHLYPVYPGAEITPHSRPELAAAARRSLERRLANGGAYTGWSRAWAIGLWARLQDGDMAWESFEMLLRHSTDLNLFNTHPASESPIFQIDGNFGATASIAEMLLQSHDGGVIEILPALPKAWPQGTVRGLCARGGLEVSLAWQQGRLTRVEIYSRQSGDFRIRVPRGIALTGRNISFAPEGPSGLFHLKTSAETRNLLEATAIKKG